MGKSFLMAVILSLGGFLAGEELLWERRLRLFFQRGEDVPKSLPRSKTQTQTQTQTFPIGKKPSLAPKFIPGPTSQELVEEK